MLARRWPTWLALALVAVSVSDLDDGLEFATVLLVSAVGYLAITVLDRPGATWGLLILLVAAVVLIRTLGADPWIVLGAAASVLAVVGLVRGQLRRPGLYALQPLASLVILTMGLTALYVSPGIGRYLVAGGLIGHAAWDALHWRANRIVARSFAEWCAVFDLVLGLAIILMA
jgi:hypothetical protein